MTIAAVYEQIGRRFVELAGEAEFAAPKKNTGAIKAKKCMTGLSCGGSCISKAKICKRALSIEQQKQFKELKKRLKGGDLDAAKGIEELKQEQQGIKKESKADSKPKEPAPKQKAYFVEVKSIKSSRPKSDFDEKDIEDLADSMFASGGLHRPILLKQSGEGYDVVDGHLAYHASARAREKDVARGEEVNAFIVKDSYVESSLAQVNKLAKVEPSLKIPDGKKFQKRNVYVEGIRPDKAYFVDVKSIKSSHPKSDFDEKDIEDLADSMIANGGSLRPLVLGKTEEGYDVIDGHLAYHAAVRAKQKDIARGEEVNGFVVEPENVANVAKQLEILDRADGKKKR